MDSQSKEGDYGNVFGRSPAARAPKAKSIDHFLEEIVSASSRPTGFRTVARQFALAALVCTAVAGGAVAATTAGAGTAQHAVADNNWPTTPAPTATPADNNRPSVATPADNNWPSTPAPADNNWPTGATPVDNNWPATPASTDDNNWPAPPAAV